MAKAMVKTKEKANPYQDHIDSLRKKQNELLDAFQRDKLAGSNTDDGIQDLADKAASAYSKELNFSLSDGERNLLMLIDEAFRRLDNETYGTCTNCGATIGDKRLSAVPWTPFCIDCQELQEKGLLS
jgi:DnaK suppressor protein